MEGLARLVADSLARHNFDAPLDHRRIEWSRWFRCESSFDLLLVPSKPGLFALAEEVIAPGELASAGGKRMLALFHISEADDLGMTLGRSFLPGSQFRDRFAAGRCFVRFAVIEDAAQRKTAFEALEKWWTGSSEAASGISTKPNLQSPSFSGGVSQAALVEDQGGRTLIDPPENLPLGF